MYKAILDEVDEVAVKFLEHRDVSSIQKFAAEVQICRACHYEYVVAFMGAYLQKVAPQARAQLTHMWKPNTVSW